MFVDVPRVIHAGWHGHRTGAACRLGDPADLEAARSTFVSLPRRIPACVNAGRWRIDDVTTTGEAVWPGGHGHATLELTGFFGAVGCDPVRSYRGIPTVLARVPKVPRVLLRLGGRGQPDPDHT
jgi:hypothetical protein